MLYILDPHHKPPLVVDMTDDTLRAEATAQRYSDQTGRPTLIATGPRPDEAHFRPTVPELAPVTVGITPAPNLLPVPLEPQGDTKRDKV